MYRLTQLLIIASFLFIAFPAIAQDTQTDEDNCGVLGFECVGGRECVLGRCSPAWLPISDVDAPTPRAAAAAVFFDGRYIVMGGCSSPNPYDPTEFTTGVYDPDTDEWSVGPDLNVGRAHFSAATNGTDIYVFGGVANCWDGTAELAALESVDDVDLGSWALDLSPFAPPARYNTPLVWTGSSLMTYGGSWSLDGGSATGGIFTPGVGWTDASCGILNCERGGSYEMFVDAGTVKVWGGTFGSAPTGLQYDLGLGTWSAWSIPGSDPDVTYLTASMGQPRDAGDASFVYYLEPDGGIMIHDVAEGSWTSDDVAPPADFCSEAPVAWTGSELIAWSGSCDGVFSDVGGRYQPPAPIP